VEWGGGAYIVGLTLAVNLGLVGPMAVGVVGPVAVGPVAEELASWE